MTSSKIKSSSNKAKAKNWALWPITHYHFSHHKTPHLSKHIHISSMTNAGPTFQSSAPLVSERREIYNHSGNSHWHNLLCSLFPKVSQIILVAFAM